jgi:sensor histidine kinase YesM
MNLFGKSAGKRWRDLLVIAILVLIFRIFYVEILNYLKQDYQYDISGLLNSIFRQFPILLIVVIADYYSIKFINKLFGWGKQAVKRLLFFALAFIILTSVSTFLFCLPELKNYTWSELVASRQIEALIMVTSMINVIVMGLSDVFLYYRKSHRNELNAEIFKKNKARFQYEQLKNQLNPHFLFNSLNVLDYLVHTDSEKASSFIKKLAGVYRYLLDKERDMLVTFQEELKFTMMYCDLMKERFDTGMSISTEIDEKYLSTYIVPCSIQLLVENALKHNIVSSSSPLWVKIYIEDDRMIVVENNLQPKITEDQSSKVGLKNIESQYMSMFNKGIEIQKTSDVFRVRIPLIFEKTV